MLQTYRQFLLERIGIIKKNILNRIRYDAMLRLQISKKERSSQQLRGLIPEEEEEPTRGGDLPFSIPFRETKTPFNKSSNTLESSAPALASKADAAHYQCPSLTIIN